MMKNIFMLLVVAIVLLGTSCTASKKTTTATTQVAPPPALTLKNKIDSVSYALGISLYTNFKSQGLGDINMDVMKAAMQDVKDKKTLKISQKEGPKILNTFQKEAKERAGLKAKLEGEKFLVENAKKPGVKTTASGLQYKVLTEGTGSKPLATDKVTVHYKGTLIDGTQFDSSYDRGQPATFPLNGVIAGWTEGVQLMKEGAKYRFFIPSKLGYGERGAGASIPANATLIFDVELISIAKKK